MNILIFYHVATYSRRVVTVGTQYKQYEHFAETVLGHHLDAVLKQQVKRRGSDRLSLVFHSEKPIILLLFSRTKALICQVSLTKNYKLTKTLIWK